MDRSWITRFLVVTTVIMLAAYALYPSYYYFYEATQEQKDSHEKFCAAIPSFFSCKKFSLGLDLQGGVHLVMGVGVEKAVEQRTDRLADSLRDALKDKKLAFTRIDRPKNQAYIEVVLAEGADTDELETLLRSDFSILEITRREGSLFRVTLLESEKQFVRDTAVEQTIKTIRNRADKFGVAEPTIARRGKTNILIQLPGVKDPERAINMIGKTAQLEFKIVEEAPTAAFDSIADADLPEGVIRRENTVDSGQGPSREVFFEIPELHRDAMLALLEPLVGSQNEIAFGEISRQGESGILRSYVLRSTAGITGDYLTNAQVQQNPDIPSDFYVTMTFDAKGANIFANLTEANARRRMAIVLDKKVNSAPQIEGKISGGSARITLGGVGDPRRRFEDATDLALVLKAGALPAPVEIREKRQVGKTLGQESVEKGRLAIMVGGILVIIFMMFYYRGSGVIANVALILNVILVLALLAVFEATLTLPGMAGIVLTIGMAVDANVIIFERIREEIAIGKTPRAAIESGYRKAFSTIVDANVTTFIAGVVLMQYGSGPVRGFAVTLIAGIICSMFTAIYVTRLIYDFFTSRRRLQSLSI